MPRRRWLQFSLRGLLVVLTAGCLWLGWRVDRAIKQAEAVKAIEELGGVVRYDWQYDAFRARRDGVSFDRPLSNSLQEPSGPLWLRRIIGDDFFQRVWAVQIPRVRSVAEYPVLNPKSNWDECRLWAYRTNLVPPREMEADILKLIPHLRRLAGLKGISLPTYVGDVDTPLSRSTLDALEASLPCCEVSQFYNVEPPWPYGP